MFTFWRKHKWHQIIFFPSQINLHVIKIMHFVTWLSCLSAFLGVCSKSGAQYMRHVCNKSRCSQMLLSEWPLFFAAFSPPVNETDDIGPLHEVNVTNPSSFTLRLSNLSISTKYKFYARACTVEGCGKPITEEGITINEGGKFRLGQSWISYISFSWQKVHVQ